MLLIERLTRPWNERQIGSKASNDRAPYRTPISWFTRCSTTRCRTGSKLASYLLAPSFVFADRGSARKLCKNPVADVRMSQCCHSSSSSSGNVDNCLDRVLLRLQTCDAAGAAMRPAWTCYWPNAKRNAEQRRPAEDKQKTDNVTSLIYGETESSVDVCSYSISAVKVTNALQCRAFDRRSLNNRTYAWGGK